MENKKQKFENNKASCCVIGCNSGWNGLMKWSSGMCKKHGVKGTKSVISTKVWSKRKDGIFAWLWKKQTMYKCTVEPGIVERPSPTSCMVIENDISTQGMEKQTNGTTCEVISGVVITGAGANLDKKEHDQRIRRISNED